MTFPSDVSDPPFALPRGGKRSRDKGMRGERSIVHLLNEHGFSAVKISSMYRPGPDITFWISGRMLTCEVKVQAAGWTRLYRWLEGLTVTGQQRGRPNLLVLKADRREPLVVMRLSEFAQLVKERAT